MIKPNDDPLIQINWSIIIYAIRTIAEKIIKIILDTLSLIMRTFTRAWMAISRFSKSKQRGGWIVLLIVILFFAITYFGFSIYRELNVSANLRQEKYNVDQQMLEKIMDNEELKYENEKLKEKIDLFDSRSYKRLDFETTAIVAKYADEYNVDRELCECVVTKESGGRDEAVGDNGKAIGVAQYHLGTFKSHRRQMGLSEEDLRTDTEASVQAMTWAISQGYGHAWTVYKTCV